MSLPHRESRLWLAAAVLLTGAAGAAFWVPGARRAGAFPVPLDDVFIHFGFARAAALGSPFQWMPGNGYSSGGTSLTYPLALAPGWLLGTAKPLTILCAALALSSLWSYYRSYRAMLEKSWS